MKLPGGDSPAPSSTTRKCSRARSSRCGRSYCSRSNIIEQRGKTSGELPSPFIRPQGGLWTGTNANANKTITRAFDEIDCPEGTTLDKSQTQGL